jgi:hypothetical protein
MTIIAVGALYVDTILTYVQGLPSPGLRSCKGFGV